jgi:hypothetical protein
MKPIVPAFVLLVFLTLPTLAQPQPTVPVPPVAIRGYVGYKGDVRAIIVSSFETRVVREGTWLGDYFIKSISYTRGITFLFEGFEITVPWEDYAPEFKASTWATRYALRLHMAETRYVLKAICELKKVDFYCSYEVQGEVSYAGMVDPSEVIAGLLSGLPEVAYEESKDALIVGTEPTIIRVREALSAKPPSHKRVSIDYLDAQLWFVLDRLARDMNMKPDLVLGRDDGVTITASRAPAYNQFLAALALQGTRYHVTQESSTIAVRPRDR